jgi:hypothetical protein
MDIVRTRNTGEVLGTPNATMKELLGSGSPNLFTRWLTLRCTLPKAKRS